MSGLDADFSVNSPRLAMRPLRRDDAAALRALTDDEAITAAISFLSSPFTLADAAALVARNGSGRECFLGLRLHDEAQLLGVVGAHLQEGERGAAAEIGYWLGKPFWGRGYAGEAVGALVGHLAAAMPERLIFAECRAENRASWRLLEKLGFCPTGAAGARPGRVVLAYCR